SATLGGPTWAWFTAWLNIVGLVTVIAGIDYGCARFLLPMLGLPSESPYLLITYALLLLSQTLINHYSTRAVAWLNDASAPLHMAGVLAVLCALLIFVPKQPLHFLPQPSSSSDIPAPYASLSLLALLQAQWTYTG